MGPSLTINKPSLTSAILKHRSIKRCTPLFNVNAEPGEEEIFQEIAVLHPRLCNLVESVIPAVADVVKIVAMVIMMVHGEGCEGWIMIKHWRLIGVSFTSFFCDL